jgi:hypothetical protein
VHSAAAAKVAASIALLTAHRTEAGDDADAGGAQQQQQGRDAEGEGGGGDDRGVWLPPSDQAGDGRTALNEKYGY